MKIFVHLCRLPSGKGDGSHGVRLHCLGAGGVPCVWQEGGLGTLDEP